MTENLSSIDSWTQLKYKSENIDKMLDWALDKEYNRICQKHSNISNAVKLLKNLMLEFSKKADNLQKSLIKSTRLQETQFQSEYYQKRINDCLGMSEIIKTQIEIKNQKLLHEEEAANQLKHKLMKIKTENIKISMAIQQIENDQQLAKIKIEMQKDKERKNQKKSEERKMLASETAYKDPLHYESLKLQMQLFNKIDEIKGSKQFIQNCFADLREKLKKNQSKSNAYGLAGSMLFKIKSIPAQLPKIKKSNSRLLVYDTLKQKYRRHLKTEAKKQEQLNINLEEFLKFSPLQIMGIIELKGGLKQIVNKKAPFDYKQFKNQIKQEVTE